MRASESVDVQGKDYEKKRQKLPRQSRLIHGGSRLSGCGARSAFLMGWNVSAVKRSLDLLEIAQRNRTAGVFRRSGTSNDRARLDRGEGCGILRGAALAGANKRILPPTAQHASWPLKSPVANRPHRRRVYVRCYPQTQTCAKHGKSDAIEPNGDMSGPLKPPAPEPPPSLPSVLG